MMFHPTNVGLKLTCLQSPHASRAVPPHISPFFDGILTLKAIVNSPKHVTNGTSDEQPIPRSVSVLPAPSYNLDSPEENYFVPGIVLMAGVGNMKRWPSRQSSTSSLDAPHRATSSNRLEFRAAHHAFSQSDLTDETKRKGTLLVERNGVTISGFADGLNYICLPVGHGNIQNHLRGKHPLVTMPEEVQFRQVPGGESVVESGHQETVEEKYKRYIKDSSEWMEEKLEECYTQPFSKMIRKDNELAVGGKEVRITIKFEEVAVEASPASTPPRSPSTTTAQQQSPGSSVGPAARAQQRASFAAAKTAAKVGETNLIWQGSTDDLSKRKKTSTKTTAV
jgi:hypothetical protein